MGKCTISMAIFQFANCLFTRGYQLCKDTKSHTNFQVVNGNHLQYHPKLCKWRSVLSQYRLPFVQAQIQDFHSRMPKNLSNIFPIFSNTSRKQLFSSFSSHFLMTSPHVCSIFGNELLPRSPRGDRDDLLKKKITSDVRFFLFDTSTYHTRVEKW